MDRKNRVRTKPVDRGMLKALCRYIDKFWRPESEPLEEAPCAEASLTLELPQVREALQEPKEARAKSRADSAPQRKGKPIVFGLVGAGLFSSMAERLLKPEETCSQRLLRMIRERGLEEVAVYTKAGVDRKLFSKMRRKDYRPKAKTLYAFIIVLQLNLDDAADLLASAGYAFSPANKFDLAVRYFVEHGVNDLDEVNDALYELGMETLP